MPNDDTNTESGSITFTPQEIELLVKSGSNTFTLQEIELLVKCVKSNGIMRGLEVFFDLTKKNPSWQQAIGLWGTYAEMSYSGRDIAAEIRERAMSPETFAAVFTQPPANPNPTTPCSL